MQKATDKEDLKFFQNSKKPKKSQKEGETEEKRGIEAEVAAYIKEVHTDGNYKQIRHNSVYV